MSSGKHTPGPWEWDGKVWCYDDSNEAPWLIQAPWSDGASKAVLTGTIRCESEANARLISAAPELLEAAKLVIAWYEAEDDHSKADFYQRMEMCRQSEAACRAAIAKATGATNV